MYPDDFTAPKTCTDRRFPSNEYDDTRNQSSGSEDQDETPLPQDGKRVCGAQLFKPGDKGSPVCRYASQSLND